MRRRGLEMKEGNKAKAKAAKTKTSGKEISSKNSAKEKGGGKAVQAGSKKESSASSKADGKKSGGAKAAAGKSNGKGRSDPATISFTNPAIESAFNRAVKKYPNAFRRLTD